jgi:uncharacterized protein
MAERELSRATVYRARPTVRVDGKASDKATTLVKAMRMHESEGGLSSLELLLENAARYEDGSVGLAFEDEALLKLGSSLALYSGDESAPQEIFRGLVTGLEATFAPGETPELLVLAEDGLQRARMARRTRVHESATLAGLARELAGRLGLKPVITGFTEPLGRQVQLDESDLAFLRRLLASRNGDMQVVGEELHVSPRREVRRGTLQLELHGQLTRARVVADLAHQATEVTVGGWNAREGRRVSGKGTGRDLGPGQGRRGADLLRQALGERSEHMGDLPATTEEEAQTLADAAFDSRARGFVCVEGTAEGNPALRVGTHLTLSGLGRRFDNTYYVTHTTHRFDEERGYETDFEARCAFLGGP